jgi:hypothetical protein
VLVYSDSFASLTTWCLNKQKLATSGLKGNAQKELNFLTLCWMLCANEAQTGCLADEWSLSTVHEATLVGLQSSQVVHSLGSVLADKRSLSSVYETSAAAAAFQQWQQQQLGKTFHTEGAELIDSVLDVMRNEAQPGCLADKRSLSTVFIRPHLQQSCSSYCSGSSSIRLIGSKWMSFCNCRNMLPTYAWAK